MARSSLVLVVALVAACSDGGDMGEETLDTDESGESLVDDDDDDDGGDSTGSADESGDGSESDSSGGDEPDPGEPWEPAPELPPLPDDAVAQLQQAIDGVLADPAVAGAAHGVLVVDGEIGQELYARNAEVVRAPASNTKLFTTGAAFDLLGPDHRSETTLWSTDAGDVVMVGHHDPSWSAFSYEGARVALDRIAEDVQRAGVTSIGTVTASGEFLYQGDNFSYYDAELHRGRALTAFRDALSAVGIGSGGGQTSASFDPPAGTMLGTWRSPPLAVTSVPLNVESHNEYADILGRHIGLEVGGTSDATIGGAEVVEFLASLGTDTTGVALYDGSGLSHDNRVSPRNVVDLLAFALEEEWGLAWTRTFSIAGVRGTLGGRMTGEDTWGRVWGKSGTLTGVIATSGILFHRHDGRRYLVSILMNDTGDAGSTRAVHDAVFGRVAADLRGLGPRPAAPTLQSVRTDVGKDVVEVAWDPVDGATGYLVWLSPDGRRFDRADARLVSASPYRAGTLPAWPQVFVRVSAVGLAAESEPSDVYGASVDDLADRVLVVDGNDRWQAEPLVENPLAAGHDFAVDHVAAITGVGVDCATNEAVTTGLVALDDYRAVIWMTGEESEVDEALAIDEQELLAQFLAGGGALLLSGAEIGWDLVELGDPDDAAFFTDVLHATYLGDDAGTQIVEAATQPSELPTMQFHTPGTQIVDFPDRLAPGPGAETWLRYRGGTGDAAAIRSDGVVLLGFPFESIDHPDDRAALMTAALRHLQILP